MAKTITATGKMSVHYDEALQYGSLAGNGGWAVSSWAEMRLGSDLSTLRATTGNFLP